MSPNAELFEELPEALWTDIQRHMKGNNVAGKNNPKEETWQIIADLWQKRVTIFSEDKREKQYYPISVSDGGLEGEIKLLQRRNNKGMQMDSIERIESRYPSKNPRTNIQKKQPTIKELQNETKTSEAD